MRYLQKKILSSDITWIFLLLLLCVIFFAKLFYPEPKIFATAEIGINDIWYFNYPLKSFLADQFKQGKLPTWNPYRGGGFPDVAESQVGTFNLYNLISFRWLPSIIAFNLGYIFIFFTTALGTYLFIKRQNFNQLQAFFGAFIYAFSGFYVTHLSHFLLIQTVSFFPLLLYFTDKILRRDNSLWFNLPCFSLLLSQQLFSGNPQSVFITLLGLFYYFLYLLLTQQTKISSLISWSFSVIIGFVISAAQLLPLLELSQISIRNEGLGVQELLFYKFPFQHLITLIFPFWFGNPQMGTYPHFNDFNGSLFWENTAYIGIIPLLLIVFNFKQIKRYQRELFFYISLLLISFLLMLGGDGPLYFVLTIPPFSYFRFPSRFMILLIFCLTMLAMYGLKKLTCSIKNKPLSQLFSVAVVITAVTHLFVFWYDYHPTLPFKMYANKPSVVEFLEKQPHGKVYTYLQNARAFSEFFKTGSSQPLMYLELMNELAPNLNVFFGITTTDVYSSLIPRRLAYYNSPLINSYEISTTSALISEKAERRLSLRNTTHVLSPIKLENENFILVKTVELNYNLGTVYIYKNKNAVSKYYLVNKYRKANTYEDLDTLISSNSFVLTEEIALEKDISVLNPANKINSKIEPIIEKNDELEILVTTDQPAVLVITNSYYPGWIATINGQRSDLFPVNLVNQGVHVPQGNHAVRLVFKPKSVQFGTWITVIGYSILASVIVVKYFLSRTVLASKRNT